MAGGSSAFTDLSSPSLSAASRTDQKSVSADLNRSGTRPATSTDKADRTPPGHVSRDARQEPTSSTEPTADASAPTSPATTAPSPTTSDPTVSIPDGPSISVLDFGAVGNGVADDTAALQRAFDAADPGTTVLLPAGKTFTHSAVLRVTSPDVTVAGGGTLLATREASSSFALAADRVVLQDLTLKISGTTKRWDAAEQQRLRIQGHTGIVIRNVSVQGSAAAGIFVHQGAANFLIDHAQVSGTRADGIHMTDGSHDGQVVSPIVRNVGDDGVAVVSYAGDGVRSARITVTSPTVDGVSAGRGVTVVGGSDITYKDIRVSNISAAAVYIAAEGSWNTLGVSNVKVLGGTVNGANMSPYTDHGAVLVYNGATGQSVTNVEISGLTLSGVPTRVSRWVGTLADAPAAMSNIVLRDLAINGSGPTIPFVRNQSYITYTATGWTRDGRAITP